MRIAQDHRPAILKTAARLFAERPFQEVLMDDIASEVGIAKGTIYRSYPNKQELCVAICMEYMQTMENELTQITAENSACSSEALLTLMVEQMARHFYEYRDFFNAMHRAEGGIQLLNRKGFIKQRSGIREQIADVIRSGQKTGVWDALDPVMCADAILGMLRNLYIFGNPHLKPAEVSRMILHIFLNGVRNRSQTVPAVRSRKAVSNLKKIAPVPTVRASADGGRKS